MSRRWRQRAAILVAFAFVPLALGIAAFPGAYWVIRLHSALLFGMEAVDTGIAEADDRDRLAAYLAEAERGGDLAWVLSRVSQLKLSSEDTRAVAAVLGRRFTAIGVHLKHPGQQAEVAEHLEYLALRGLGTEGANSYFSMLMAISAALLGDRPLLFASLDHVRTNAAYRDYASFEPAVLQQWQLKRTGYLGERMGAPYSAESVELGHFEGLRLVASRVAESDAPTAAPVALLSLTQRIFDNSRYGSEIRGCDRTLSALAVAENGPRGLEVASRAFRHELDPVSRDGYLRATMALSDRLARSNAALNELMHERAIEEAGQLSGSRRRALGLLMVLGALCAVGISWPLRWAHGASTSAGSRMASAASVAALCLWLGATLRWHPVLAMLGVVVAAEGLLRARRLGAPALCAVAILSLGAGSATVFGSWSSTVEPWLSVALGVPFVLVGAGALSQIAKGQRAMAWVPLTVAVAGYTFAVGQELRDNAAFAAMRSGWRYDVMMAKRSGDAPAPSADRQVG